MPLDEFQRRVLKLLYGQRSPASYIAGGAPIAAITARFSGDFDIFHDRAELVAEAARADERILEEHGLSMSWTRKGVGIWSGEVLGGPVPLRLDWAHDSGFRFFPVQPDDQFGFVLHPADLATNKALTIADRHEARDVFDLVALSDIVPIAAAAVAAPAKDPGYTPESLIGAIRSNIAHPQIAFDRLRSTGHIDGGALLRTVRAGLSEATDLCRSLPNEAVGKLYRERGRIVVPDPARIASYDVIEASFQGIIAQAEARPLDVDPPI
jgi:hypothetical protein